VFRVLQSGLVTFARMSLFIYRHFQWPSLILSTLSCSPVEDRVFFADKDLRDYLRQYSDPAASVDKPVLAKGKAGVLQEKAAKCDALQPLIAWIYKQDEDKEPAKNLYGLCPPSFLRSLLHDLAANTPASGLVDDPIRANQVLRDLVTWINGPGREEGLLPHELAEVVERHCPFLHELIDSGRWRNDQELRQACAPLLSHIADVIIKPYRGASGMLY